MSKRPKVQCRTASGPGASKSDPASIASSAPGPGAVRHFDSATFPVIEFDLYETLNSGQVFHWDSDGQGGFVGCIGEEPIHLQQAGDVLHVAPGDHVERVKSYLGLDLDHGAILSTFPSDDPHLTDAVAFCPGLRIIRQPPWECLATFITSALKQVAHIRQISLEVRRRFGNARTLNGHTVYTYPSPQILAEAGEAKLRECGMGFRARGLAQTAEALANGSLTLEAVSAQSDDEARRYLCQFHGVGPKIADCVLLFGFGRLKCFPIDVWIERVLTEWYLTERLPVTRRDLEEFVSSHFGEYKGYAQQYLFHYARKTQRRSN